MLERFSPNAHYFQGYDPRAEAPYIFLLQPARHLWAQHYERKYRARLAYLESLYGLSATLAGLKQAAGHTRAGFFVGKVGEHSIPLVYIRENGEEALLYFDSQGHNSKFYQELRKRSSLPIYSVKDIRQADFYSCFVDALIILRDCTAREPGREDYRLPDLLTQLKARAVWNAEGYFEVKLPDALLKTAQLKRFRDHHKEAKAPPVHKNETLDEFLQRFLMKITVEELPGYLRIKGIKTADCVETQFYLNQLRTALGAEWTEEMQTEFLRQAKCEFASQGEYALNSGRAGLHTLAQLFHDKIRLNDFASLAGRADHSPEENKAKLKLIAETLLNIINDSDYWRQKSCGKMGLPTTIGLMQQGLRRISVGAPLSSKISLMRHLAVQRRQTRSMLFLLFGQEERDPLTEDFYKIFTEDWLSTPLFEKIVQDWRRFNANPKAPALPSVQLSNYQRVRLRY